MGIYCNTWWDVFKGPLWMSSWMLQNLFFLPLQNFPEEIVTRYITKYIWAFLHMWSLGNLCPPLVLCKMRKGDYKISGGLWCWAKSLVNGQNFNLGLLILVSILPFLCFITSFHFLWWYLMLDILLYSIQSLHF